MAALFVLGWGHARFWLRHYPGPLRRALFGVAMGLGTIASMLMAFELAEGVRLDLRGTLLAVSGFFGGPVAAALSVAIAAVFRLSLGGGGMVPGMVAIALTAMAGLGLRWTIGRRSPTPWHAFLLGVVTAAVTLTALAMLPGPLALAAFAHLALPIGLLTVAGTMLAGLVFLKARQLSAERDLLAAGLAQSPDFTYVKDRLGRFAAVNAAVAQLHGFATPEAMLGKTDFDLDPTRAPQLFEQERAVLSGGASIIDFEEQLTGEDGQPRWFSTSKVPLRDADGTIIGLAGVSRDITADKKLRQEVVESRNTLSHALAEMSDGLAMFDSEGRVVFANEQYRASFPRTGHLRQAGVHLRDILKAVVQTEEQATVPRHDVAGWIERIVANLNQESEEEVNLFDGRWLQVRTRPTSGGSTMVVTSDITRIKQAELALHTATDQLKQMVRTDSLTDLLNRRAFDDALEAEIGRSARTGAPLSLVLVDVDRFKAYNDTYGHPGGDAALKLVSQHLQASLKRPADVAARYGGEEFAAILPDTDEDGAYLVAEGFRRALAEARVPHSAGDKGYLTASVGVATYGDDNLARSAPELVQAADEALYGAKAAGRDRVFGTRIAPRARRVGQGMSA